MTKNVSFLGMNWEVTGGPYVFLIIGIPFFVLGIISVFRPDYILRLIRWNDKFFEYAYLGQKKLNQSIDSVDLSF